MLDNLQEKPRRNVQKHNNKRSNNITQDEPPKHSGIQECKLSPTHFI